MSVEVICTPYGLLATERLGEQISVLKNGDPLAPVTVVVPTNIAGLATRRALGGQGRGIAAVGFLKLFDLAERLAGRQMAVRRKKKPVSDSVVSATVRSVLSADPGLFQASARHPATEQALVRSYRDLRDLPDERFEVLASQSARAADVVRICRQVRDRLKDTWYDGQDLNDLAIEALESDSIGDILKEFGPVIIYLPQRVTRSQGLMVSTLAQETQVVIVAGLTGNDKADRVVLESVGHMGGKLDAIPEINQPHGQRVVSTASADEEIRVAVREVVNAARDGIPLSRIAVLCGGGKPVFRQMQDHLQVAGIQCSGPSGHTLADTLVGRVVLALLNLKSCGFRRDEVFALLSEMAPTLPAGKEPDTAKRKPAPVMAWERISCQAGVARGADQWETRLAHHAEKLRKDAAEGQERPDHIEERVEWLRREADHADSLARFMAELVNRLSPDPAPTTWKLWCQWVKELIDTYLEGDTAQDDWPEPEKKAAKEVRKILDRLAGLEEIEPHPRVAAFLPTLVSELSAPTERVGQVGKGVFVGRIGDSLGMALDRLTLVGMAEGIFPHSPLDDPLLPDRERKAVGDDPALNGDQHRSFLAALAFAQFSTLVYARGDSRRSAEQHPSRWLLDTATALAKRPVDSINLESRDHRETDSWHEHVPSFSGRVVAAADPAADQEFRLKALARAGRADDPLLAHDSVLIRGAELAAARTSDQFTRFDGNLADLDGAELTQGVVSPTSLETWADCPMRYLFKHVLRVQAVDHPEDLLEISALNKGSLIHQALEDFLKEQLEDGKVPPHDQIWNEEQRNQLLAIGEEKCNEAESKGLTGTPVYWRHDRNQIMADLDRFIREDNQLRKNRRVTPIASEMGFGIPDSQQDPVEVELSGHRTVRFRGQADRVDEGADGLLVSDYKTGKFDRYKGLDENSRDWDPVQRGTRLQLPVYGLAARNRVGSPDAPVRAQYWFVTGDGEFKTCGYPLDESVLSRFRDAVATITEGICAGVFCDRPQHDQTRGEYSQRCEYCNSDRLGTEDGRGKWERMQGQQELADYRNLAEPTDEDPDSQVA